jgi:hypothetical protein
VDCYLDRAPPGGSEYRHSNRLAPTPDYLGYDHRMPFKSRCALRCKLEIGVHSAASCYTKIAKAQ